jgi:hypothetical protein
MTRRNSILGALFLSALCFCAFGAANAFAVKSVQMHECVNTGGNGSGTHGTKYVEGCGSTIAGGVWETVKQVGSKKLKSTQTSAFTLAATVAGVKFKIECSTLNGTGEGENSGEVFVGKNIVEVFSGCAVTEPAGKGCTVTKEITTNTLKAETKEMNVNFTPAVSETFVTITISGCSVGALNGEKPVTGSASAVFTEEAPNTAEFTATSGSVLKFGGQAATFIGKAHSKTAEGTTVAFETP